MKTNTALANIFFVLTLTASISSCGSGDQKQETTTDTTATTTAVTADQPAGSTETFKEFDWNTVPDRQQQSVLSHTSALLMAFMCRKKMDSFNEMAQNQLKAADYSIKETGETSIVAGYNCSKSIYTLKKPVPANNTTGAIPAPSVYQLEVWTSTEMPKSVNFLHPLYIKEDAGIVKIMIQYEKESPLKFLYEFTKVENRAVTAKEMQIQKTAKIHDFGKDKMTVGMQMMGIVFGM
ncbi:hypothetical protein [Pedobacter frigoris]|uniref:Lipoprotein n=1 Tax=Pedobacter frigoris TaxID=2571272 RepID=A0A4V5P210_9SPHI|nr:hypothetical protein [Pedobacter frigoris]TKC06093.1 hypothetical protein FA047_12245 [Pedobacter frigoris]